ncbi:MAG: galactose ABC transporter substrate-binding protein [Oscillospiraceae bacterium]|nr:galactose ABC transporter substrate-binding protein [Oscillospiraceae bacterium]
MIKYGISKLISCMLILAITLTVSLAGCAEEGQKIAFFKYKGGDTFISEMMGYMTARVPPGVAFEVRDAGNSQSVQNQQIVELVSGGFDLLVINAVDRLACSSIIEKCAVEKIPIIFFNREPPEDALVGSDVFYVGADTDSMGKKQAEMVAELFGGDFVGSKFDKNGDNVVQTVILKGEQGHQDAEKRTDNCIAHLKSLGYSVDVMAIEVADWNRRDGYEAMKLLFEEYGDSIELIFSNNDDMALGAIDYLLDEGIFSQDKTVYEQSIVVVGVDGTEVGLEAIEKGLLYGTVNNDYKKQSDAILTLVDYILSGDSFRDFPYSITRGHYIYFGGDIITKANLEEYLSIS